MFVKPKKSYGQHFLNDEIIAKSIVDALTNHGDYKYVLEIGPGMGVLTKYLLQNKDINPYFIEVDEKSVEYLIKNFQGIEDKLFSKDFLVFDLNTITTEKLAIIGNFPYNISTQILFKVLDNKDKVPEVVGMFQKEVAERIASKPNCKDYGIISVLLQAYYDIEYLITVPENVFTPPPKVLSAVIRLKRNNIEKLPCDEALFKNIIKTSFNQRRKMLRGTLKQFKLDQSKVEHLMTKRPENLSVDDFVLLTNSVIK